MAPRVPILLAVAMAYPVTALGYGETTEDRPNAHERAVHFFTDQLRVDPGAHDSEFDREPLRPLAYNPDLNDAARFYADDMATNGCFPEDHSSCDGTSAADRITSFYGGPGWAENIALGSPDAWSVVYDGWLYSAGHRRNMLNGDLQELGTGFSSGDAGRLWVQDFGFGTAEVEPILTSGTHWPLRPNTGDDASLQVAVYDPAGDSLVAASVDLNGACRSLDLDLGGDGMETWARTFPLPEEPICLPYVFTATTAAGQKVEYPTTGSLMLPVGGQDCPVWTPGRVGSDCVDAASGLGDDDDADSGLIGAGAGCASSRETDPNGNVTDRVTYATCAAAGSSAPSWALALVGLSVLRRRRA
jgi:uncharacterized protein (TIGR03382 family)